MKKTKLPMIEAKQTSTENETKTQTSALAIIGKPITARYEIMGLLDAECANPNGDPDNGNAPRQLPTGELVLSDGSIKRRIRDHAQIANGQNIFVRKDTNLSTAIAEAHEEANGGLPFFNDKGDWKPTGDQEKNAGVALANKFFDIRAFGAVLSTGPKAGQFCGPVQVASSISYLPAEVLDVGITRMASSKEPDTKGVKPTLSDYKSFDAETSDDKKRTMGNKHIAIHALFPIKAFVNPFYAEKTGFSDADLNIVLEGLLGGYDLTRSASKGIMSIHGPLVIFKHVGTNPNATDPTQVAQNLEQGKKGCAKSQDLFSLVQVKPNVARSRSSADYSIMLHKSRTPKGVQMGIVSVIGGKVEINYDFDEKDLPLNWKIA